MRTIELTLLTRSLLRFPAQFYANDRPLNLLSKTVPGELVDDASDGSRPLRRNPSTAVSLTLTHGN